MENKVPYLSASTVVLLPYVCSSKDEIWFSIKLSDGGSHLLPSADTTAGCNNIN